LNNENKNNEHAQITHAQIIKKQANHKKQCQDYGSIQTQEENKKKHGTTTAMLESTVKNK
jgi:hypothetical protein